MGAASVEQGTLVFAYRTDDALLGHLHDAVAHFANGHSLLLLDSAAADVLVASSTAIHEPLVVRAGVTRKDAVLTAEHIEALLATGLSAQSACEAALSLAAV
jgi:hypothetical protein